ncbi:glycoside hydrolase family 26 protein [Poritiphilus flavus]|uniref:GH26 domain-containing protein n=1 Tax=Poritiphilus flavus TaxID=2697053 RepID=A0A6L9EAK3_9FLAO|nr:glycosyl hydrolase [Poritiphilus flavus]NAS11588.1 hypothetical protein [Poritiphilus flavus]
MRITLLYLGLLFLWSFNEQGSFKEQRSIQAYQQHDQLSGSPVFNGARSRKNLLAYFDYLVTNGRLIAGQQCGDDPGQINDYYQEYVGRLAGKTNKFAGLIGADLGTSAVAGFSLSTLIDHWEQGGLISLSWQPPNPFRSAYESHWNSVEGRQTINMRALLRHAPESKAKWIYRNELDEVAKVLQDLQQAGVVVIWRPFKEMNSHFYWYGIDGYDGMQSNEADFTALWQDMYNTFRYDYSLDNLLWTYSASPDYGWNAGVTSYYPGSDYVDLVGINYYGPKPDFPNYDKLKGLGKTVVMTETGPSEAAAGYWDELELIRQLSGKVAYFLQWHSWNGVKVAIKDNRKANYMMNSSKVVTRDELKTETINSYE